MQVEVGSKIAARGLAWEVLEVAPLGALSRLRLCCLGGDLNGLEWDLLHPLEPIEPLNADPDPLDPAPLEDWRRYHLARWLEQIPGPPAPAGRLAVESWQKVPLLRALGMIRPRLLLADGVGLGKTVQAGLIAADLIVRRRAHRILVVTPPGPLLQQWRQEMRHRFGLRFTVIADAAGLRAARQGLELGGNPFRATGLCLASLDFAKQDHVLAELEQASWDLVIIDEAHHCIADGTPNQRRILAEVLAARSDGLLLLTATPHDGHDAHFASLIALLDPCLVDNQGRLIGTTYRRHVVRRLKTHIRDPHTNAPLFRERVVLPVRVSVPGSGPVPAFHAALAELVGPRLSKAGRSMDALAFVSLLKRSMSTLAACIATLRVVADRYATPDQRGSRAARQRALRHWRRRMARFGVLDPAAEEELAELEAEEIAATLSEAATQATLRDLIHLGEIAAADDPKLAALKLEIRLIRLQHPGANILVYTEYADSQRAAFIALSDIGGTVLTISGADNEATRAHAADRFAAEDGIVLLSTDSLAEGLNLQARCCHLIHLDLPYNPNRLEQRNGRIDRYGQRRDPEIRYLYLADTFEERLLLRLIAKYEKARACLSVMPNTFALAADPAALHEPLFEGSLFSALPRPLHALDLVGEDANSTAYRDMLREIERAFDSFDRMAVSHGWLSGTERPETTEQDPAMLDLAGFAASILPAVPGGHRVPVDWLNDLEGLPGFDAATSVVRLTRDPGQMLDAQGQSLMYPGRAHPLIRRVAATVRSGRVSAAQADRLALLATFIAEAGSVARRIVSVLLAPDQAPELVNDPMALAGDPVMTDGVWTARFAAWARVALADLDMKALAAQALTPIISSYRNAAEQREDALAAWLARRSADLCGPPVAATPDLFGDAPTPAGWRTETGPVQRLIALADDPDAGADRRTEARAVLAGVKISHPPPFPPITIRPCGLLMLVP